MVRVLRSKTALRAGVALSLLLAGRAEAQPEASSAAAQARAQLAAQANTAFREGRYADSREAWLSVWELDRSQVAACNIGALSHRMGDPVMAVRWLTRCKEIMRAPETPDERALYASRLADLARARQLVGEIRVVAPAGAMITIDGEPAELAAGGAIPVLPGRHVARAELNGAVAEAEVNVPRGETREARLTPRNPETRPPERAQASGARAASGGPPAPPAASRAVVVAGGIGAGVFVAAGAGLFALGEVELNAGIRAAQDAGPNRCYLPSPACDRAHAHWDTMETARAFGAASLILGGAVAAGTLAYALWPRQSAEVVVSASAVAVRGVW
ncbi:hypothetical protein SCE1572_52380 [Sorangium cellulosum So0157-2]|uniref:PEGA domain-containing protein n=1 Tax=Sorangium cellulosum So0157-2 TaxID=1254432 RepID=S4YA16_SORCE|nr:hypothetical protein SCE1572_52380 [Sorangium cellulosum So0157-2]